ncbi:hypothetical protein GCM10009721_39440 [Terrabacter tumescens]|uniref:Uncharacterized protein n=1 Tax=Terrabacter tumescens TaxID=60443 RepID=A0ABQ2IEM6_9MICO|nr:hypothetical protein [Terrabacter tumescens]GGN07917.1 hypothetical protein GCM10009721_39440 [Terrabacter tumescens]
MSRRAPFVPDGVPVLSRGRHRSPRKGACFMEMASFLAGERWSDHPSCTHPVLATLARCVNDMLDETHRQRLVTMIPEVVGLNPDDPRVATALVLTAARAALPISAEERQNVMALAILNAEGVLAEQDGRSPGQLSEASRKALTSSPAAERWARIHLARMGFNAAAVRPPMAAKVVALAVDGIARACVDDPEDRLVTLLRDGIDVVAAFAPLAPTPVAWVSPEPTSAPRAADPTTDRQARTVAR